MECEILEVSWSLREWAGEGRTKRCCIINNLSEGTLSSYKRKCTRGVFLPGLIRRGTDSPQPNPYKQALSTKFLKNRDNPFSLLFCYFPIF